MTYSAELLERFKTAKKWTDAQIATWLNVKPPYISMIRNGKEHLSDGNAVDMCKELSIEAGQILIGIKLDRTKEDKVRHELEGVLCILEKLKGGAIGIAVALGWLVNQITNSAQCNGNSKGYRILTA